MTLKVIGAGLGRTGTLSLKLALEYLGFGPCYHMVEVLAHQKAAVPRWMGAVEGKPDWESIFDGYVATVDYPGCYFWRELSSAYPDARIILSLRDPESWFNSVSETIFSPRMRAMTASSPAAPFFQGTVYKDFGERIDDREFMTDYFRRWNAAVIEAIAPERLLVFEARDGWAPLCSFLSVDVPDVPYPRVNSREEMVAHGPDGAGPPSLEEMEAMAQQRIKAMRSRAFGAGSEQA